MPEAAKLWRSIVRSKRGAPSTAELAQAADHEAGHAIMSILIQRHFKLIRIPSTGELGGCNFQRTLRMQSSRFAAKEGPTGHRPIENVLFLCLAGTAAESGLHGPSSALRASSDLKLAVRMAGKLLKASPSDEITQYLDYAFLRTRNILANVCVRGQTKIIARRLLVERELTYDGIDALLSKAFRRQSDYLKASLHGGPQFRRSLPIRWPPGSK